MDTSTEVLNEVYAERMRQDSLWGVQDHDNGVFPLFQAVEAQKKYTETLRDTGKLTWSIILKEEFTEAIHAYSEKNLRSELIQVAAVCVAWVECIDRSRDRRERLRKQMT